MSRLLDGRESNASSEQLVPRRNVPDSVAHYLARAVITELSHPTERLYGEMLCLTLAMHMLRTYGRARIDAVTGRLSPVQARHALEYIHANLHDDLSVHALAREAGLSEAHFARAFRATFNEAPHRLVLRWRLERAMRLIKLNNFSLADAAAAAGFYDQSHLTNAVRRHFATSPGSIFTL
jgi:AraC family transcriptional regulator